MDFNTATNATNNGVIAVGANDLHWTSVLTNSLGTYVPSVRCVAVTGWATSPWANATWITHPKTCSANPSEHSCLGNIDEFYKLTFTLPANACNLSITTPSAYCLSLDFFSDNWVWAVYVNGVLTYNNPTGNPYNSWGFSQGNQLTAVLCNNWVAGTNNVIVHTKSGAPSFPGWSGFLAQANQTVNPNAGNPLSVNITATNNPCGIGTASAIALGGGGGYTYTWSPSGGNAALATNLTAGIYTVTVNSTNGCTTTNTVSIAAGSNYTLNSSPNATICSGSAITLTANGASTYTWSPGPLNTAAITVTPASSIIYSVTGNNSGCIKTNTVSITVLALPVINIASTNPTLCSGSSGSTTLTASGANTYTWQPVNLIGNSIVVSPAVTTVYSVTATNASGCNNSNTVSVTVAPSPTINIVSSSPTVCAGNSATLTASGASGYTWNPSATIGASMIVTPSISASYTVTGITGVCSSSSAITINVLSNPSIVINASPPAICSGQSSTLSANGASSYTWQPMNTLASSVVVTPLLNTNYTVTGVDNFGCTNSANLTLTVTPTASVSLVVSNSNMCEGTTVTLTASGAPGYTYYPGPISINPLVVSPSVTTTYTVFGANGSCGTYKQITINVIPNETISAVASPSLICEGRSSNLIASGGSSYVWMPGGSTSNSVTVMPAATTIYTVHSPHICSNTFTIMVSVIPPPIISVSGNTGLCVGGSNTLTANGANTYTWSTGSNNTSIVESPTMNSTYHVVGTDLTTGCTGSTSAFVAVSNYPQITVPGDSVCFGRSLSLEAFGASSYTWNTGDITNSISISPTINTTYTVTGSGTLPFCTSTQTVNVRVLPAPMVTLTAFPNTSVCKGEAVHLTAMGADYFVWGNGVVSNTFASTPKSHTVISVIGINHSLNCQSIKTVQIYVHPIPEVRINADSIICEGDQTVLKATGADVFQWNTGAGTPSIDIIVKENEFYTATGLNSATGCYGTGTLQVVTSEACCEFWIPNTFTPNDDVLNDGFGAKTFCKFSSYKLTIFDRWGERVFESDSTKKYWDGNFKGKPCKEDVYVYLIEGVRSGTGISKEQKYMNLTGHVVLLR